jgi:hypothetical protein
MMEAALLVLSSLTHQTVGMGVEIDAVAEGLDAGHNPRHKLFASDRLFTMSTEVDNKKNLPSTGVVSRQHWISRGNRRQGAIQGIGLCTFYTLRAKARTRERQRPKCRAGREAYEKPSFGGSFA